MTKITHAQVKSHSDLKKQPFKQGIELCPNVWMCAQQLTFMLIFSLLITHFQLIITADI